MTSLLPEQASGPAPGRLEARVLETSLGSRMRGWAPSGGPRASRLLQLPVASGVPCSWPQLPASVLSELLLSGVTSPVHPVQGRPHSP